MLLPSSGLLNDCAEHIYRKYMDLDHNITADLGEKKLQNMANKANETKVLWTQK